MGNKREYKKMLIDFKISDSLEKIIDEFLDHINNGNGKSEDCYRDEISFYLKDNLQRRIIDRKEYLLLDDYYVLGGIYDELGPPWKARKDSE